MISEGARIPARAAEHRILHYDAVLSNADWRPLGSGASVFNGAVLEQGVVVAINAVVHVGTRCVAGTGVPIGHIALGDPATIYPPHEAPTVHAQLRALGFTKAVFGLEAQSLADAGTIEKVCERYARSLRAHRDDAILAE